jgi:diguanylate cyclase (GGDEF)-like protein
MQLTHGGDDPLRARLGALEAANEALREQLRRRRLLTEQLRFQAFHDSLTGLANRALFTDRLAHALAARRRDPRPIGVLFLDLDDFKKVNDTYGHAAGDALLAAVGERLQACVRPADTAARLGGDEFAILLGDAVSYDGATHVAGRVIDSFQAPFELEGNEVIVHVSVGVTLSGSPDDDADSILRAADAAMYAAKHEGKNRFVRACDLGPREVADVAWGVTSPHSPDPQAAPRTMEVRSA